MASGRRIRPPTHTTRVLFIGNSFTYVNNLPDVFRAIAQSGTPGHAVVVDMVARGGATLESTWKEGRAQALIAARRWDYVVLQEQSSLGSLFINGHIVVSDPQAIFYPYARRFDAAIRKTGAHTVFFLTWASQDNPNEQQALTHAYTTIARELHASVAPVGLAWATVRQQEPNADLFDPAPWDGLHPSPTGTYLSAAVLVATLFGESPVGSVTTIAGHTAEDGVIDSTKTVALVTLPVDRATSLQSVAWNTVTQLRHAGGYVESPTQPLPELPRLPRGSALTDRRLDGAWKGTLALYYRSYRSPESLELTLRKTDGTWSGKLAIVESRPGERQEFPISRVTIEHNVLTFTVPNKKYEHGDVTYRGVLTARGLEGIAEFGDPSRSARTIGTWTAVRSDP